jgi:hypothetical protein
MADLFCLACNYCVLRQRKWELGFCTMKEFRIHDPFKKCQVGKISDYTIHEKGMNLMKLLNGIQQNNVNRKLAIMKWRSIMGWDEK